MKTGETIKNESQWLDELQWISRRCDQMRGWWTATWVGHVKEQARKCQFPQIAQAILDCLEREESE